MQGPSGVANCYVKIDNCASYYNEHCNECVDSYVLDATKLQCNLICNSG